MTGGISSKMSRLAGVVVLTGAAYAAGAAHGADSSNVQKLNSAVDFMVKAQALLNATSPTNRTSTGALGNAKTALGQAIDQTSKAVKAEGG